MKNKLEYQLPMYSSSLLKEPEIRIHDMDIEIKIEGFDENNKLFKVTLLFTSVLCNKHTSARFTPKMYGAYDKVVQLINSEWLEGLKEMNQEDFAFWNPRHYVLYLDSIGMYQFIAQNFTVILDD